MPSAAHLTQGYHLVARFSCFFASMRSKRNGGAGEEGKTMSTARAGVRSSVSGYTRVFLEVAGGGGEALSRLG